MFANRPAGAGGRPPGMRNRLSNKLISRAIPPGSNTPPAEVFGVIETALRVHFARAIEP